MDPGGQFTKGMVYTPYVMESDHSQLVSNSLEIPQDSEPTNDDTIVIELFESNNYLVTQKKRKKPKSHVGEIQVTLSPLEPFYLSTGQNKVSKIGPTVHTIVPELLKKRERNENMNDVPTDGMCAVCKVVKFQFHHFGAFVCNRCRAFFRRIVRRERNGDFITCLSKKKIVNLRNHQPVCDISVFRNACKACRYVECLRANMNVKYVLSDIDRMVRYRRKNPIKLKSRNETFSENLKISDNETIAVDENTFSESHISRVVNEENRETGDVAEIGETFDVVDVHQIEEDDNFSEQESFSFLNDLPLSVETVHSFGLSPQIFEGDVSQNQIPEPFSVLPNEIPLDQSVLSVDRNQHSQNEEPQIVTVNVLENGFIICNEKLHLTNVYYQQAEANPPWSQDTSLDTIESIFLEKDVEGGTSIPTNQSVIDGHTAGNYFQPA